MLTCTMSSGYSKDFSKFHDVQILLYASVITLCLQFAFSSVPHNWYSKVKNWWTGF